MMVPSGFAPPATGDVPPFGAGDWTVSGNETFADRSIILAGNLVIMPGGSLTISNSTLTVFSSYPVEHEILVRDGGALRVFAGSMVNAFDTVNTFRFTLEKGSAAVFANSTFIACGIWYDEVGQQMVGGITSFTDLLTVENCTFAGAHIAFTAYAPARFSGTAFSTNYIGVIGLSTALDFSGCSFLGNTFAGVWPYRCVAGFSNCTFINNSLGVSSDESNCRFLGCYFAKSSGDAVWASSLMHQFMGPSTFRAEDCIFEDNAIGIGHFGEVADNKLSIVNCDFLSNSLALDWGNSGYGANPAPGATNWNVTRPCLAQNNRFLINGNINISEGGALDLAGSNLTFDCDFNGESGLLVEEGARVEFSNGSLVRMNWGSQPYYLRCLPGSAFRMEDTVFRDCGWDLASPRTAGPLFDGADVRISSSEIDYNPVGLQFNGTDGAEVLGCRIRGLEWALWLDSSSAEFCNCSLESVWGPSAWLDSSSALECVNSTIDRNIVRLDDNASRLNLSWYLDVRARWADGSPAEGALVSVSDRTGSEVVREELGTDGRLRGLVLREASLGLDASLNFTPHTVNCSLGAVYNRTVQTMDQSRLLDIVLEDRDAPSIAIAFPGPDAVLSSGTVAVNGTASDNLVIEKVELVIDGFRRLMAQSAGGPHQAVVWWDATLALLEGPHTVEARAYDRAGNYGSAFVSFTVDWSAPRIRIASPSDGSLTNRSLLAVSGFMEPGCRVLLGGSEVRTERDTFGGTVVLGEGENLVTATALDRAGNSNPSSVRVRLDTLPPSLAVLWPPDGFRTNMPMVAVNGTMEPGSSVTVNGRQVALTGEPGTFRTAIALPRESNLIAVDAVDPAGNHNLTMRTVTLDTRPPALEVESPPEGLLANRTDIWLTGSSEGGALLSVEGCLTCISGEPGSPARFAVPLALSEGTNTVVISASDAAGNLNCTARHIIVDTRPPGLSISAPENGHRTSRSSVFVIGETEPGASVSINSQPVPVGQTGLFSLEVRLSSGLNRFMVNATDAAGNTNGTSVEVRRLAAAGDEILPAAAGPDWPFLGFVVLAAGVCVSEWFLASSYIKKRRGA
jgi:hypothetical protein